MIVFSFEYTQQLCQIEYKPSSFEIVKITKKKYKDKDKIYEALTDDSFPHSPLTPSLAANLIEMKFNLGVPFYRYSQYLINHGLNISDINIYHYAQKTMDLLNPLYQELLNSLINTKYKVIHSDETPLKVIESKNVICLSIQLLIGIVLYTFMILMILEA